MTRRTERGSPPVIEGEFIQHQVTRAARTLPLVPQVPKSGVLDVIFGTPRTLESDAEHFRQRAALDRAFMGAMDARGLVLRKVHELGQLPLAFKRDDEIREMEFEYQCEQLGCATAQVKAEAMRATVAIARANNEITRYQQEATEQSLESGSSVFAEELKAKQRMRRTRDDAIASVRRSRASPAEKELQINEIDALYERNQMLE